MDEDTRLLVLKRLCHKYGKLLHNFAASGNYRHSGGLDNLYYHLEQKAVLLTDLDSSRPLSEVPEHVRPLQIIRDLTSALYKIVYRLSNELGLEKYSVEKLREYNLLGELIGGFFSKETPSSVSDVLWNYFLPYFSNLKEATKGSPQSPLEIEFERDMFFVLSIILGYRLYQSSDLMASYPGKLSETDLLVNAERYLNNRYPLLERLLSTT